MKNKSTTRKQLIILLVLVSFVFVVFDLTTDKSNLNIDQIKQETKNNNEIVELIIRGQKFEVEVVATLQERMTGLSKRENLPKNTGMLFVFEAPGLHPFWMKDMNFPIDIIWLNEDFEVVHVEDFVSPSTYPESFAPDREALYVLEISAGLAWDFGIGIGDRAILRI